MESAFGRAWRRRCFSVAKQRLPETMREHRAKLESVTAVAAGKMTVGDAVQVYLEKVRANVSLKPRSKDYRETMIDFISRTWPSLSGMDVRKVGERDCQEWLVRFQKQYAPSVVNNAIGTRAKTPWCQTPRRLGQQLIVLRHRHVEPGMHIQTDLDHRAGEFYPVNGILE